MYPPFLARALLLASLSPLLVAGCRSASPPSTDPTRTSTATTSTTGSTSAGHSAFVVLTADETLVIPIDPTLAVKTLPGHFVGALPGTAPGAWGMVPVELTTRSEPQQPSLPVCTSLPSTCELYLDSSAADPLAAAEGMIYARGELVAGQAPRWRFTSRSDAGACTCVFVRGLSTDGPAIDLDDPDVQEAMALSGYDEEEYLETCSEEPEADLQPTTYVGGVLYLGGLYSNFNCSGYNLYSAAGEALPLRPGAVEPSVEPSESVVCERGTPFGDDGLLAGKPRLDCEPNDQREAYALRRGRLVRFIGSAEGPSEDSECNCASSVPLGTATCSSPLDPCGQGRDLPPPATPWEQLWVTTDERLALAKRGKELLVLAPGRDAPIRTLPAPTALLGVEHHPDTTLLDVEPPPSSLRVAIPPRHETDATFEGSAKQWGNRCFAHLQAERLDAAEAACFAGLLAKGNDGTRGALTYNLGRIEEARGDRARARAYYERSQRLRPNDATAKRLRALASP